MTPAWLVAVNALLCGHFGRIVGGMRAVLLGGRGVTVFPFAGVGVGIGVYRISLRQKSQICVGADIQAQEEHQHQSRQDQHGDDHRNNRDVPQEGCHSAKQQKRNQAR
jgi:hypothetical protein